MLLTLLASSGNSTTVHIAVTIQTLEPEHPADTEWLVVAEGAPIPAAAIRDRQVEVKAWCLDFGLDTFPSLW